MLSEYCLFFASLQCAEMTFVWFRLLESCSQRDGLFHRLAIYYRKPGQGWMAIQPMGYAPTHDFLPFWSGQGHRLNTI